MMITRRALFKLIAVSPLAMVLPVPRVSVWEREFLPGPSPSYFLSFIDGDWHLLCGRRDVGIMPMVIGVRN